MSIDEQYESIINRSSLIASIACGEFSPELLKLSREQLEDINLSDHIKQEILPYEERVVFNQTTTD